MKISEKLKLLQEISELTQQKLADKLGVSFVTFNAWINDRSQPRAKAILKIDELFSEYTGNKTIPETELLTKKQVILKKRPIKNLIINKIIQNKDIYDSFVLALTYHSNKIEGSSLSEDDTAAVIFDGINLTNKTLVEQIEAKNHQTALIFLFEHISNGGKIDKQFVFKIHSILMNSIIGEAGLYRRHGVRIVGSPVVTANYLKIPELMKSFYGKGDKKPKDLISYIAKQHAEFERIHPFSDGNGRTGRLIIIAQLLKNNLPPAVIRQEKRRIYISCLVKAQTQEDSSLLEDFLCDAILLGFKILERKI